MAFNKYKSVKVDLDGYSFASKMEAALYHFLKVLVRAGEYTDLKCQVQVRLPGNVLYKPDFSAVNTATKEVEYFEAKGFETASWRIKRKLWISNGPGKLHIYMGSHNNIKLKETLNPKVSQVICPNCNHVISA